MIGYANQLTTAPNMQADIWEGNSTIVEELAAQCSSKPDAIVLSVGGGGLLQGVVEGLDKVDLPIMPLAYCLMRDPYVHRLAGRTCR